MCSLTACWSRVDARILFVLYGKHMTALAVRTPGNFGPGLLYGNYPLPGGVLRDDLFSTGAGSAPAEAVLLAAFPYANVPVLAATACLGPFDLDPATILGRQPPGHILLQCFGLAAAFVC